MRRRTTTTCRSRGLARRIVFWAGALALAGFAAPAAGQELFDIWPPRLWAAQEHLDSHEDAHDEGVDIVYWLEEGSPDRHWIFVTGWVTEMDDDTVVGTRFATFKYDATDDGTGGPPDPQEVAYFPPLGTSLQQGDTYKAVAMDVDPETGDIYVTGQGPPEPGGSDQDYIVIKYDKVLDEQWSGDGARYYDGPVSGDDIPADIMVAHHASTGDALAVVVTGTSPGDGTGLDIATVAWLTSNGNPAGAFWPSDGVRRYNHDPEDGDDRAVELGGARVEDIDESTGSLIVIVLGTSYGGSTTLDDYTTHQWTSLSSSVSWEARYDNGGNDVAAGLAVDDAGFYAYVTGYSEGVSDIDYATVSYLLGIEEWVEREDYVGEDDFAQDIRLVEPPSGDWQVWVTGAGMDGTWSDAFTVRYLDDLSGSVSGVWAEGAGSSTLFEYGRAITVIDDEPYIAGSLGNSNADKMYTLAYYQDSPYTFNWSATWGGPAVGGVDNEARGIVVVDVDGTGERSIYVVGVSTKSGEGREFTTLRYKEEED